MFAQIFLVIQLILKAIGLWEQFMHWSDAKRVADQEKNKQDRDKAVGDLKNAKTEEDFDKAQDAVVSHNPKP